jgi:cysteine desulfurase
MKKVYLDNAATTPVAKEVLDAMIPYLSGIYGNPSSTHAFGRESKAGLELSRRKIAKLINAKDSEILFTSGGTEADNLVVSNAVKNLGVKHVITSPTEHHAVLHPVENVDSLGIKHSLVNVDGKGNVDLAHLSELIDPNEKTLVSLMHANNEIGTLLPLKKAIDIAKSKNAYFHSDTVQTMGHYTFDVMDLGIDFLTCSAHKLHGPKGIGFLYHKQNIPLISDLLGGGQERGLRAGTENLAGIIGMAKALELAFSDLDEHQKHVSSLKEYMKAEISTNINDIHFNGETGVDNSLYTVLSVSFPPSSKSGLLLFALDLKGIATSGGSACSSGAQKGSHVISAIKGMSERDTIRFSFSRYTTKEEIDYTLTELNKIFN